MKGSKEENPIKNTSSKSKSNENSRVTCQKAMRCPPQKEIYDASFSKKRRCTMFSLIDESSQAITIINLASVFLIMIFFLFATWALCFSNLESSSKDGSSDIPKGSGISSETKSGLEILGAFDIHGEDKLLVTSEPSPSQMLYQIQFNMPSELPSDVSSSKPTPFPTSFPTTSAPVITSPPSSSAPVTSSPTPSPTSTFYEFYATGDTPYGVKDKEKLVQQLEDIPRNAAFIYHLGDIFSANRTKCKERAYISAENVLLQSKVPVFITPGNNDWSLCPDPKNAWEYWEKHFTYFDQHWNHTLSVRTMWGRPGNLAFVSNNILFIGVHLVGGDAIYSRNENRDRLGDDLTWTIVKIRQHEDEITSVVIFGHAAPHEKLDEYFDPLARRVENIGLPVLYLHAEGSKFKMESNAFGVKNMWRVQVGRGGRYAPLRIRVTENLESPFKFYRQ